MPWRGLGDKAGEERGDGYKKTRRRVLEPTIRATMSVAFTREEDSEASAANLPDRPISPHPNYVTPQGLAQIEAAFAAAKSAYAAAQVEGGVAADRTAMARATRDLRYWSARRGSAQLVEAPADHARVAFGLRVGIEREDGRAQVFRIVGEDEADPKLGAISYVSPLARALLGKEVGDTAPAPGGAVEVVTIDGGPQA
jgi:transcription elongation GreA/GreB family factor